MEPTRGVGGRVAAVVAAGGRSTRYGSDKIAELLDHVLASLPPAVGEVVCVGPPRQSDVRAVRWVREDPPLGGPLAAVAAGLAALDASVDVVLVLGGDMPRVGLAVPALLAAVPPGGVAVLVSGGQAQPLASAWSRPALAGALEAVGDVAGRPLRLLLGQVRPVEVVDAWDAGLDVDEPLPPPGLSG